MLYITSLWLTYFITERLYFWTTSSLHLFLHPPPQAISLFSVSTSIKPAMWKVLKEKKKKTKRNGRLPMLPSRMKFLLHIWCFIYYAFQTAASVLGLGASEFVQGSFKWGVLVSYSLLALLSVSPVNFFKVKYMGAPFPGTSPSLGSLTYGSETSVLRETSRIVIHPFSLWIATQWVWVLMRLSLPLLLVSMWLSF